MPEPKEPSLLRVFAGQLANAPSLLLAAGAVLSIATGGIADAVLIGTVLAINATIGTATERSGNRAIAALKRSVSITARVRRDGEEVSVEAAELVPGDVVKLMPGDPVPADARVVLAHRLQVEESALTGESEPVWKESEPVGPEAALHDRRSLVYRGTTVVGGHGEAVIVATGQATVLGGLRILAASSTAPPAPLERDLDVLGRALAVGAAGLTGLTVGLGVVRGIGLIPAIATGISLAVAAIPEGLAAIATTVLALGSRRMRKKGTLIRTLGASEALGSVTVVCADKTGTLTENRMALREIVVDGEAIRVGGDALSPVGTFSLAGGEADPTEVPGLLDALRIGALCTDAELETDGSGRLSIVGSSTEGALLIAAAKAGLDPNGLAAAYPRIDRRDRAVGRNYMITMHRAPPGEAFGSLGLGADGGLVALAKGAPREIMALCDRTMHAGDVSPLDDEARDRAVARNLEMADHGLRVMALAAKRLPEGYSDDDLRRGFVWYGLVGLVDPIRADVPAAVRALHRAGVRTIMITGDQARTAVAVARQLGLSRRGSFRVIEGTEFADLPPDERRNAVRDVDIFARVPPELKLAVVRALQESGEIVAMTGDGVNDAAALRAADVGVAMGESGTELARELADVVLSTDDFARFVDAVEEGRLVRANVRRVLHYLLATNASEVWVVTTATAAGLPVPLSPLQLLWLNVISDVGPAIGLATEGPPADLMAQPPRDPKEPIVSGRLWRQIGAESAAISLGALGAYGAGLLLHGGGPTARTMAFASLTWSQLLHVPLARSGEWREIATPLLANPVLGIGIGVSLLLQLGAVFFPPLRAALGGGPIGLIDLLISAVAALVPILGIQLARLMSAPRLAPAAAR